MLKNNHQEIQVLAETNDLFSIIGIYQSEKIILSIQQLKLGIIDHKALSHLNHQHNKSWQETANQFNQLLKIISQEKSMAYIFTNDDVYFEKLGVIYQDITKQKIIGKGQLKIDFTPSEHYNGLILTLKIHYDIDN